MWVYLSKIFLNATFKFLATQLLLYYLFLSIIYLTHFDF